MKKHKQATDYIADLNPTKIKVESTVGARIEQNNSNTQIENEAIEGAPIGKNDNSKSKSNLIPKEFPPLYNFQKPPLTNKVDLMFPGCVDNGPILGRNSLGGALDDFNDLNSKKPANGKANTIAFNPNAPKRNKQLISNIKMYGRVETQTLFPFVICTYRYDNKKGIGISRCSESDKWNESEGIKKAAGRALRALVCKLERRPFPQDEKKYMG